MRFFSFWARPIVFVAFGLCGHSAWAAHGYALWGDMKYPPGFEHFDYVNVNAPKGGEIRLVSGLRSSTFDKYNPFTIKGTAPAYLTELMFDSLLISPLDEPGAGYGLLAEDVSVAPDGLSATFRLNPRARFQNGDAVTAQDVKHSYDTLVSPAASPSYRTILMDVAGVDVLNARTVRYRFKRNNRELPLTVGSLPIFSRAWGMEGGKPKPFDQVVTDTPIGSGPYKIGPVKFGKDITYVRDPGYWAKDLNVKRGTSNFDRVLIKIYKDNTARLEALKAGEFDLMTFYSAGDWARRVNGKRFESGELVKGVFPHRLPMGFQSYVLNTRRTFLSDVRVREALGLAIDYEWMNRQLFYGAYRRVHGLFGNTDCEATGTPDTAQLALLAPWRKDLPSSTFGPAYVAPTTNGATSLRDNLKRARTLLHEAGWDIKDGLLRNAKGEIFELEYLDSGEGRASAIAPWQRNLQKLGITLKFRSADYALYQERLSRFDFDMVSIAFAGTLNPGQEFADLFGSVAADQNDSGNLAGVRSRPVDDLINRMVSAKTKPEYLAACRALERVISHGNYLLPQWYSSNYRMVYNSWRLTLPTSTPPYFSGELWAIGTWWARMPAGPTPLVPSTAVNKTLGPVKAVMQSLTEPQGV